MRVQCIGQCIILNKNKLQELKRRFGAELSAMAAEAAGGAAPRAQAASLLARFFAGEMNGDEDDEDDEDSEEEEDGADEEEKEEGDDDDDDDDNDDDEDDDSDDSDADYDPDNKATRPSALARKYSVGLDDDDDNDENDENDDDDDAVFEGADDDAEQDDAASATDSEASTEDATEPDTAAPARKRARLESTNDSADGLERAAAKAARPALKRTQSTCVSYVFFSKPYGV